MRSLKSLGNIRVELANYYGVEDSDFYNDTDLMNIQKDLEILEIIKRFVWLEDGEIHIGIFGDIETILTKEYFETETKYELIKSWLTQK